MRAIIFIFVGGGLGSIARYLLSRFLTSSSIFPVATFVINVLACVILGTVVGIASHRQVMDEDLKAFWIVGFCGGFSTSSAFAFQNLEMFNSGQNFFALLYILLSVVICILACWGGIFLGRFI